MIEIQFKKKMMEENIKECKFGVYRNLPNMGSIKCFYNENYNIAPVYEYCSVEVQKIHALDVAFQCIKNEYLPVVVNFVTYEFTGGNMQSGNGIRDELINIRTSFNKTNEPTMNFNHYPLRDSEVVYTKICHIIRNSNLQLLYPNQVCKISLITAPIKKEIELINNNLTLSDYILMKTTMETIFQTASTHGNDVIILNDCGITMNNFPIDDIIRIINGCIYKYGHLFKYVIVAILATRQSEIAYCNKFNGDLIKPQALFYEGKNIFNIAKFSTMDSR